MITLSLSQKTFWQHPVEGFVLLLKDDLSSVSPLANIDYVQQNHYPALPEILKKHNFEGKAGQSFVLTDSRDGKLVQFLFVGVGKQTGAWEKECETMRRAVATAVQLIKRLSIASAVIALPDEAPLKISDTQLLEQLCTVIHMADYDFITFKSDKKPEHTCALSIAINERFDSESYQQPLSRGSAMGLMINTARHWADTPPNIMTPTKLAQEAEMIAKTYGLKSTVFGRDKAIELGMGAFLAVDEGSEQEGKFVVLEYKTTAPDAPTIALCGKGVTFDTGGISLKPSSSMDGMKFDMSGAAAVIASMALIAQFKPNVNVVGITPLVENMPSGRAARQDDVVFAMNGKSIEIKNTDAEGRLILSDALCYAEKFYNPAVIIDVATLTGACLYALGHFYSAVMTKDADLAKTLTELGKQTGDRVWELPLDDDFFPANKSEVADVNNSGSSAYLAGTIIGAAFLSNFVSKARWAHLDIAGTAHHVPGVNYVGKGATGASIRLLMAFVMGYNKA